MSTPKALAESIYTVSGTVYHPNGLPAAGVIVKAFDRDLRKEELLGQVATAVNGGYTISYKPESFCRAEKARADLCFRVDDRKGTKLYSTPFDDTTFNAPVNAAVDIYLTTGDTTIKTEFQRIMDELKVLMSDSGLQSPADLSEDDKHRDISFISRESGLDAWSVENVAVAFRLCLVASPISVTKEFFYALLAQRTLLQAGMSSSSGLPIVTIDLSTQLKPIFYDIVLLPEETVRGALSLAVRIHQVSAGVLDRLPATLKALSTRRCEAEKYRQSHASTAPQEQLKSFLSGGSAEKVLETLSTNANGDLLGSMQTLRDALLQPPADIKAAETSSAAQPLATPLKPPDGLVKHVMELLNQPDERRLLRTPSEDLEQALRQASSRPNDDQAGNHFPIGAFVAALEDKYPTMAFTIAMENDDTGFPPHREEILKILRAHDDADLAIVHMDSLVEPLQRDAAPNPSVSPSSTTTARHVLSTFQRLFRVCPKYQHVRSLMNAGILSATNVHSIGKARFAKTLESGPSLSDEEVTSMFERATNISIATSLRAGELAALTSATRIAALAPTGLGDLVTLPDEFPNLKTLFQMGDFCGCTECRTVHSAAAYVADALHFLSERRVVDKEPVAGQPPTSAKQVLFARRPDLGDMDLSCDNTNIPLPYIDVVCEILEEAVAPETGIHYNGPIDSGLVSPALLSWLRAAGLPFTAKAIVSPVNKLAPFNRVVRDKQVVAKLLPEGPNVWRIFELKQTYGPAELVKAAPQYVNAKAYALLEDAEYAFGLPFSIAHQECKAYFGQFNVSRADLMQALQTAGAGPTESEIAAEILGLTVKEYELVSNAQPLKQDTFWGIGDGIPSATSMANVQNFVDKSGLGYTDLHRLLTLPWLNPTGEMFVKHLDNSCTLAQKRIVNLGNDALDRLHRFIRLMRKIPIPAPVLDRLLNTKSFGGNEASLDNFLKVLSQLFKLHSAYGLTWDVLSYLFDVLPTTDGVNSPYNRIFMNQTANGKVEDAFEPEKLALNETADPASARKLADFDSYLALCLGVSLPEMQTLLRSMFSPSAILSLKNVSAVYAMVIFAKSARLSLSDFVACKSLTGIDILLSPEAAIDFLDDAVKVIGPSKVKPKDLRFYLFHEADDLAVRELPVESITSLLDTLIKGYESAARSNSSPFIASASADENQGPIIDLLSRVPSLEPPDIATYKIMFSGYPWPDHTRSAGDFIDSTLGSVVASVADIKTAQASLASAPPEDNELERKHLLDTVVSALSEHFYLVAKSDFLLATAKQTLKINDDLAPILLQNAKLVTAHQPAPTALMVILTADFPPPSSSDSDEFRAVRLLHKMNSFVATLKVSPDQVKWMLGNNASLGWMDLNQLKYQDDPALPTVSFEAWKALQDVMHLMQSYPDIIDPADPAARKSVFGLFDLVLSSSVSETAVLHYFATLAGLDETVLSDLVVLFNADPAKAYKIARTFRHLERCAVLLRTLGISVSTSKSLIRASLDLQDAATLRQALKSRYSDDDWLGVLKTIQDPLRRMKRDALANYLLSVKKEFRQVDDLYDHYLIDVQMGSCMDTSRVVQAHATVQMFVQRCFLGLEIHSVANEEVDPRWGEWNKWMANYRVWELNKKVFLFPHQFLDPAVRKDKSELFLDFESSIQQDQLTDSSLEASFAAYLEKLDYIAHVDVMACYYETAKTTMHIFARSKGGDPAKYFHRSFLQERSWTPWEQIPVDITGNFLLSFERNTVLTLAWPIFTEDPDPAQTSAGPNIPDSSTIHDPGKPTDKVKKRWKIQLAASKLVNGKWTPKLLSREAIYFPLSGYMELDDLKKNHSEETFTFFCYQGTKLGQAIGCFSDSSWLGAFALTGCSGYPEATQASYDGQLFALPNFEDTDIKFARYVKRDNPEVTDLGMRWSFHMDGYEHLLNKAAPKFVVTYPFQLDLVDTLTAIWVLYFSSRNKYSVYSRYKRGIFYQFGTFMPYFYGDSERTYTIIPGRYGGPSPPVEGKPASTEPAVRKTYADIFTVVNDGYNLLLDWLKVFAQDPNKDVRKWLEQVTNDPRYKAWLASYQALFAEGLRYSSRVRNLYHPLVCTLRTALNSRGVPGLMDRSLQLKQADFKFDTYRPTDSIYPDYPVEDLDFSLEGAYAGYNWELFFHAVYEVAQKLNQDQRFEQAQLWLHYIFNPLAAGKDPIPRRYWVTKPFQLMTSDDYIKQRIDKILGRIAQDPDHPEDDLKAAVLDWRANPFDPWMVAKTRTIEYQIAVVLFYVKNLCDWGDSLFRQFTREAITQATQLYMLAHKLLGSKPSVVAPAIETPIRSYNELESRLDLTGNAMLDLENLVPKLGDLPHGGVELPPLPYTALYFCVPPDASLLSYWDLVDNRLTKIRTCRNIDGVEAPLSLFSPPIDFGALSRALAGGQDLQSFLAAINAPLPAYKFRPIIAKAIELAGYASSLGNSLLQALEKRDAEALARLKSTAQVALLKAVRDTKVAAITEAKDAHDGLELVKAVTQTKHNWYTTQPYMNAWEITATALSGGSLLLQAAIALGYILSGGLKLIPTFTAGGAGFGGSPVVNATIGGQTVGNGAEMAVASINAIAAGLDKASAMASAQAGYRRRQDEWDFQASIAKAELDSITGQIATAKAHWDTAVADLAAHDVSAANADDEDAFMHSKYTNQELYDWMVRQFSGVYLAAYKLAFDMGKKAERCYQLELARDDSFLSYEFDTLKKGLLSAESLQSGLHLLQTSYMDKHKREFEISKDISLRMLDPRALLAFRATGKCVFQVPEALLDLDYPGHYMRRHRAVSLTIPCVVGPFTSISCRLTQLVNRYRRDPGLLAGVATPREAYDESSPGGDVRFAYNVGTIQSIATSTCQQDSGLFQVGFEDERYLPFEGTGVVATWQLEMPAAFRQFDYETITDVILHVKYTARDGGSTLASAVKDIQLEELNNMVHDAKNTGLFQAYSVRQRFSFAWNQMMMATDHSTKITVDNDALPFFTRNHSPTIDSVSIFAAVDTTAVSPLPTQLTIGIAGETTPTALNPDPTPGSKGNYIGKSSTIIVIGTEFSLQLVGMSPELMKALKDVVILIHYVLTE